MSELHYIQKCDKKVNGQYRYASHDQVTAAIHPHLVKYGIYCRTTVKDVQQEGNRTVVTLGIDFINADNPDDMINSTYVGYGIDQGDKGPGKAISYAYKYALLKGFCLETGDDPDQEANAVYEPVKCLEFDSLIPNEMNAKQKAKLNKFLAYSADALQKHIEDVKREAVKRPASFWKSFENWKPKDDK